MERVFQQYPSFFISWQQGKTKKFYFSLFDTAAVFCDDDVKNVKISDLFTQRIIKYSCRFRKEHNIFFNSNDIKCNSPAKMIKSLQKRNKLLRDFNILYICESFLAKFLRTKISDEDMRKPNSVIHLYHFSYMSNFVN